MFNAIKTRGFIAAAASVVALSALSGCSTPAPLNYSPSSVLTASGATTVSNFIYTPAVTGKVQPNQIQNTALGSVIVDQNIDSFFRDAVFKELRFVGVKTESTTAVLTGNIKTFLIDDLGYSVDWTLVVEYTVKNAKGEKLYTAEKSTRRNTAKFVNVFGALNETVKLNIEEIIKDPAFLKAIK